MANINRNKRFEDNFTEKIYDDVFGFISLTKPEKELLSTSYFQRLNHIKQLGLAYFVFPGAVHTRFSHSLGVLHITEKLIQRLQKVGFKAMRDPKIHQITRLAALLHDIGHYPLSHTIEKSYLEYYHFESQNEAQAKIEKLDLSKLVEKFGEIDPDYLLKLEKEKQDKNKLKNICNSSDIQSFLEYYDYKKGITKLELHHEYLAGTIIKSFPFKKILKEKFSLNDEDISIICNLINGTNTEEQFFIPSKLIKSKFDADQMDYMLRDTVNTGVNVSIDLDFIIDNLEVCPKYFEEIEEYKQAISFNIKALQSIEQFILAKYYWYSNILYYDKAYIVNAIAQRIYSYFLINENLIANEFKNITGMKDVLNNNPHEFFFFNDSYFWNKIKAIINNKDKYPEFIYKLARMLVERQFPKVMKADFFDTYFKGDDFNLIKYYSQVLEPARIGKQGQNFKNKINELNSKGNYYVGLPIEKEILSIGSDNSTRYLENEDININISDKECKKIIDFPNQFVDQFLDESKTCKKLYTFKVYNFEEIL